MQIFQYKLQGIAIMFEKFNRKYCNTLQIGYTKNSRQKTSISQT